MREEGIVGRARRIRRGNAFVNRVTSAHVRVVIRGGGIQWTSEMDLGSYVYSTPRCDIEKDGRARAPIHKRPLQLTTAQVGDAGVRRVNVPLGHLP
jgi:hypothetical protein